MMTQTTLSTGGFDRFGKTTRRAAFLAEMDRAVPWSALCILIKPVYPKEGNGRPPVALERKLRIYFLQNWFNLSDPTVEESLYDSVSMREFVCVDLGREGAPDERESDRNGRRNEPCQGNFWSIRISTAECE